MDSDIWAGREVGVDCASPGVRGLAPWRADDHVRQRVRTCTLTSARNATRATGSGQAVPGRLTTTTRPTRGFSSVRRPMRIDWMSTNAQIAERLVVSPHNVE